MEVRAVAMKTTKRQTTQTPQENLYKIDWNAEIDWDLLEELEQQEEGQSVPMQDLPDSQSQAQEASSQEEPIRQTIPSEAVLQKLLK
jgi:hypothetical protein